ncbi:hypothetical protein B0H17DRAFT_335686 [Mycena rosella]|uniref:Uncharacterized protein n=1 Tax=Mycena rosella TaxID=1033263 RepID=A0AAD7G2Q0_MYCRO|nr:hypothetical protein B0H17DRAFT_335686 [Mycena rosella]
MFIKIVSLALILPGLVRAAATLKPGVYHVVNLGHPYAPASFDTKNRVFLPEDFSGNYDLWEVIPPSGRADSITIQNLRGKTYAQIPPPAEGQFVSTGKHPSAFTAVLSGTADFPGDGVIIPDTYLDYWTVIWSILVSIHCLTFHLRSGRRTGWSGRTTILSDRRFPCVR